jgi:hypothetical protein
MTVGEPKWFASDRAALDEYLKTRHAKYATAKPIESCPHCAGSSSGRRILETSGPHIQVPIAPSSQAAATRHSLVYPTAARIKFGPKEGTDEHAVRADLRAHLGRLVLRQGEKLHAVFAGPIPVNSDVENYLLYNIFDSTTNRLLLHGVRFELHPAARVAGVEYRYASAPLTGRFVHWESGLVAAEWPGRAIVPGNVESLLSRVWWTLRRASPGTLRFLPPQALFCATIRVMLPAAELARIARPDSIKRLIDGLVSAFQYHEAPPKARARIAAGLRVDETIVDRNLRDRDRAVLGAAERAIGLTMAGVQWNPDDTRLVAVDLSFEQHNDAVRWVVSGAFAEARHMA